LIGINLVVFLIKDKPCCKLAVSSRQLIWFMLNVADHPLPISEIISVLHRETLMGQQVSENPQEND